MYIYFKHLGCPSSLSQKPFSFVHEFSIRSELYYDHSKKMNCSIWSFFVTNLENTCVQTLFHVPSDPHTEDETCWSRIEGPRNCLTVNNEISTSIKLIDGCFPWQVSMHDVLVSSGRIIFFNNRSPVFMRLSERPICEPHSEDLLKLWFCDIWKYLSWLNYELTPSAPGSPAAKHHTCFFPPNVMQVIFDKHFNLNCIQPNDLSPKTNTFFSECICTLQCVFWSCGVLKKKHDIII